MIGIYRIILVVNLNHHNFVKQTVIKNSVLTCNWTQRDTNLNNPHSSNSLGTQMFNIHWSLTQAEELISGAEPAMERKTNGPITCPELLGSVLSKSVNLGWVRIYRFNMLFSSSSSECPYPAQVRSAQHVSIFHPSLSWYRRDGFFRPFYIMSVRVFIVG